MRNLTSLHCLLKPFQSIMQAKGPGSSTKDVKKRNCNKISIETSEVPLFKNAHLSKKFPNGMNLKIVPN